MNLIHRIFQLLGLTSKKHDFSSERKNDLSNNPPSCFALRYLTSYQSIEIKSDLLPNDLVDLIKCDPFYSEMKLEVKKMIRLTSHSITRPEGEEILILHTLEESGFTHFTIICSNSMKVILIRNRKNLENIERMKGLILNHSDRSHHFQHHH